MSSGNRFALVLSDSPPGPLGVASPGTSEEVRRADAVNPLPTPTDLWNLGAAKQTDLVALVGTVSTSPSPRMVWQNMEDVTVGNTTSETSLISPTGLGTVSIPGNFLVRGGTFTLEARGTYNTGLVSALLGTLTIRAKIDDVVMGVATLGMTNFAASMTNKGWSGRGDTVFRNIAGNNIAANTSGVINYIGSGVTAITEEFINNSSTVDRTVPHSLNITAQFSSAQPSNSIKVTQLRFWYTPPIP